VQVDKPQPFHKGASLSESLSSKVPQYCLEPAFVTLSPSAVHFGPRGWNVSSTNSPSVGDCFRRDSQQQFAAKSTGLTLTYSDYDMPYIPDGLVSIVPIMP